MRARVLTVKLLVNPSLDGGELDDAISGLLTEIGQYGPGNTLLDWAYVPESRPVSVELPEPYTEGTFLPLVGITSY